MSMCVMCQHAADWTLHALTGDDGQPSPGPVDVCESHVGLWVDAFGDAGEWAVTPAAVTV